MQRILRLCIWQLVFISFVSFIGSSCAAEQGGIRIRGPKSSDAFPYDRYGPVTKADTLWNIALKVRPDPRLSIYQVMQALYQTNPQAFKDNNLNHLVSGQYLKIPSIDVIRAINSEQARQRSDQDDDVWQEKVAKLNLVNKKAAKPAEQTVKKKDLEAAKSEINEKLVDFGSSQEQKLATIQNDVLDSIDGLQAILKENEALRKRLSNFNEQLNVMQEEVAKGEEIKLQMDGLLTIQQELLDKAKAREQELLLEKQRQELADQNFVNSTWFTVLMAILPASLVISLAMFFFMRTRQQPAGETIEKASKKASKKSKEKAAESDPSAETEQTTKTDDESLPLDEELSLDDELAIDLSEDDLEPLAADDQLLSGDELDDSLDDALDDSLDDALEEPQVDSDKNGDSENVDEVIHLDDELDDLEDISLDSDNEGEVLEGGALDQGDLDDLLSGLADDSEGEALEGGELDQSALDDLLAGDDLSAAEQPEVTTEPEDIDALLDANDSDIVEDLQEVTEELSDPDDIDALLDNVADAAPEPELEPEPESVEELSEELSDPDDIDALLDNVADAELEPEPEPEPAPEPEPEPESVEELSEELSDPDDIDALLADLGLEDNDDVQEDDNEEITDPDDIDALLGNIGDNIVGDTISATANEPNADSLDSADDHVEEINTSSEDISELSEQDSNENRALIDNFTEEYIAPFLNVDFSDINQQSAADDNANNMDVDTDTAETESDFDIDSIIDAGGEQSTTSAEQDDLAINDDLDIDALLSENTPTSDDSDTNEDDILDIGDDLDPDPIADPLENEQSDSELDSAEQDILSEQEDSGLDESSFDDSGSEDDAGIVEQDVLDTKQAQLGDDDLAETDLAELEQAFDEAALSQLLDEQAEPHDEPIELTPDFTSASVLSDLLSDQDSSQDSEQEPLSEAREINDIKELDDLDFDELLANIEEETQDSSTDLLTELDEINSLDDLDIGDELLTAHESEDDNFVSVDDLLSDSLDASTEQEPYEKTSIDVGLDEFPEFTDGVNKIDVDQEDSDGFKAKLDLAKVYLDMDDGDNAEVILLEVLKQGSAEQQEEAQRLLEGLK